MRDGDVPFWLVWREHGAAPRFVHTSQDAAEAEARRLAAVNPGDSFFVLAAVTRVTVGKIKIERFGPDPDDMVPF